MKLYFNNNGIKTYIKDWKKKDNTYTLAIEGEEGKEFDSWEAKEAKEHIKKYSDLNLEFE